MKESGVIDFRICSARLPSIAYPSRRNPSALAAKACWRIAECYALGQDKTNALFWLRKSISFGFTNYGTLAAGPGSDLSQKRQGVSQSYETGIVTLALIW
jgi:hypothetical protein